MLNNILLISTDLLIQSRVATAAMRLGLAPPTTSNWQAGATWDGPGCGIVILDLSTPGLDLVQAVPALRKRLPEGAPLVAFAPHVHAAKLTAARQAGCDEVLSRGQFDREIEAVMERWLSKISGVPAEK